MSIDVRNLLAVDCIAGTWKTLHPGGAAYTPCSGIWQTTWLEPVPQASFESLHAIADLTAGILKLTVNARTPVGTTEVAVTVSEGGKTVATATDTLGSELTKGVRENLAWYKARMIWVTTDINVPIPDAKPWTPDSPVLYDLTVQLKSADGAVLDTVRSYVRTVYEKLHVHSRTEAVVKYLRS